MERYCGLGHEEFPGRGLSYDTGCPFAPQRSSFYLGSSTEGIRRICCHPICFSWKKLLYLALPMAFLCRTQLLQCMCRTKCVLLCMVRCCFSEMVFLTSARCTNTLPCITSCASLASSFNVSLPLFLLRCPPGSKTNYRLDLLVLDDRASECCSAGSPFNSSESEAA